MHTTRPTSNAGQLSGCTSFGASISMATETPIFTDSHNMKLTALTPGDMLDSRLVMPRAIKAPGTTTAAAPYSADHACSRPPPSSHANSATTPPTAACTATTRHGDTCGFRPARPALASRQGLEALVCRIVVVPRCTRTELIFRSDTSAPVDTAR